MTFDELDRLSSVAVGGAQRPDSFTNLDPTFRSAVDQMVQAAAADGVDLRITSAYRSPELQARLWQNALAKYGDPEIADNWVARPGSSMHNKGLAVDFGASGGGLLRDAESAEAAWIRENAARFGLDVPLSNEPWQVELAGARGKAPVLQGPTEQQPKQMDEFQKKMALMQMAPKYSNALNVEDFLL